MANPAAAAEPAVTPEEEPKETPPAQTPEPQEDAIDDIDALELREAEAEAEAEEAEAEKPPDPAVSEEEAEAVPGVQSDPAPAPQADGDQGEMPMIPKARFDELAARNRNLTEQLSEAQRAAIYQQGRADAMQTRGGDGDQAAQTGGHQQAQTPDQMVAGLRQEQRNLAEQYEDGELTMTEYETKRQELDDSIFEIRTAALRQTGQSQQQSSEDLLMEERTAQILERYPAVNQVSGEDLEAISPLARRQLEVELGRPLAPNAADTLQLRERVAKLANDFYGTSQPSPSGGQSGAPTPASAGQNQANKPSVTAEDRRRKLETASRQPANLSNAPNQPSGGLDGLTDEAIEDDSFTDEAFAALPEPVQKRLLEGT